MSPFQPGVSIVIPAYKAERFLAATIASVQAQTGRWELIVIDDGSPDGTGRVADAIARDDGRVRVIHRPNRGVAASRNDGLAMTISTLPYVLFLDADDLLEQGALRVLTQILEDDSAAIAAYGRSRLIDEAGRPLERGEIEPAVPTDRATLAESNCVRAPGAMLIRKSAAIAIGAWDQSIAGVADWDYWFRLAGVGPIQVVPETVLAYRVHEGAMSRQGRMMRRAGLVMRRQWLDRADAPTRALIRRSYRKSVRRFARQQLAQLSIRRLPFILFCLAKALPLVPDLILTLAPRHA